MEVRGLSAGVLRCLLWDGTQSWYAKFSKHQGTFLGALFKKDLIEVQVPVILYVCELNWHILARLCVIAVRTKFWVLANPYGKDLGGIYLCIHITISQVDIADFSTMYVKI